MPAIAGSRLERLFLALVSSLALSAWVAVLLAEIGWLQAGLFAAAAVAATTLAIVGFRRVEAAPSAESDRPGSALQSLAAAGVVIFCAAIFFPPYETFAWGSDSTVYLSLGAEIARSDGFELRDPLLAEIEMPARDEIFRNRTGFDATGIYARLPGGFAIADIAEPTVVAGFSPVFPALLAVVYDFLGVRAMPWVAPAVATLGMLALFLLGSRLGGTVAGIGATTLAAASMPQVWFAKFPMPEIVAELFVVAALLALYLALANNRPLWGSVAGLLLGIAALGKFELLPIVAITLMAFVGAQLLWTGRGPRRVYRWLAGAFAVVVVQAALHYLLLPTHYTSFIRQQMSSNYAARALQEFGWVRLALVAALVGIAASIALSRSGGGLRSNLVRPRWWGTAMLFAIGAYFLNDASAPNLSGNPVGLRAGLEETVAWLGWYLPWPVGVTLTVAAVAVAVLSRRQRKAAASSTARTSAWRETVGFVAVLVLVACMHLYRSPDVDEHIWTMRRFLPIVLPGLALLTATLTVTALRPLGPRRGALAAALVLVALTIIVAIPSLPILGQPLWEGSFEAGRDIAALLPEGSVVLMSADLAGTHLATTLNYIHGVRTIVLRPPLPTPTLPGDLAAGWIEAGRPVFVIKGERIFSFYAPELSLAEVDRRVLAVRILERTRDRAPQRIVTEQAPLTIARLFARRQSATAIDVGNPADDTFFQLVGFYGEELDPGRPDASFRWTIGSARILIPPVNSVRLTLSGARPDGVPPARVSVSVDGVLVVENLEIANEPMELVVDFPSVPDATQGAAPAADGRAAATAPPLEAPRMLVLTSTTFLPSQAGGSSDERQLGVRLYGVELSPGSRPSVR